MKNKKKFRWWYVPLALILVLGIIVALPQGRSVIVMAVYDRMCEKDSIQAEKGLYVKLPGGASTLKRDWYPFVICFEAGTDFGRSIGEPDTRLTILYNFGAFGLSGHSSLFDQDSPYYNSFYGAYMVTRPGTPYGFNDDMTVDKEAMVEVPCYDFSNLVLAGFGLKQKDFVFDWQIVETTENVSVAGYDGWTRMVADLRCSSAAHNKRDGEMSYFCYGAPSGEVEEPLKVIDMKGLVYVRYFEEKEVSVFLYALCTGDEVLAETDENFLLRAKIVEKD